jgi:MFS family permease
VNLEYLSHALQAIPTILVALLIGPWSDRFGRTLPVIMPLVGFILFYIVFIIISTNETLGPDFILLECLQVKIAKIYP